MIPLAVHSLPEATDMITMAEPRAVVSIVNSVTEVTFRHARHLLRSCFDLYMPSSPVVAGHREVEAAVAFAREIGPEPGVLVHCNWGESRSPAAAWAMLLAWGWEPNEAWAALQEQHPRGRRFRPNRLMVEATETQFSLTRTGSL